MTLLLIISLIPVHLQQYPEGMFPIHEGCCVIYAGLEIQMDQFLESISLSEICIQLYESLSVSVLQEKQNIHINPERKWP